MCAVAVLCSGQAAIAQQKSANLKKKVECRADSSANQPFRRKLWDGYEVSLRPHRNDSEDGGRCTAAIYSRDGRVQYRTTGFNVVFDEDLTGKDFEGDGKPDVVFRTDTGRGNDCCWVYNIVSPWPKPHRLFDVSEEGLVEFKPDAQGKMTLGVRRFGGGGDFSMASRPFAEKVYRVNHGKLVDSTPEFCKAIFSDDRGDGQPSSNILTPDNLRRLRGSSRPDRDGDLEAVASALQSRALQHVFCRQFDKAMRDLNLWP